MTENTAGDNARPATGVSRRSFLASSAGVAAGAAAVVVPAAAVIAVERATAPSKASLVAPAANVVSPTTPMSAEPLTAILRSLASDEVTVLSGTTQTTVRDPALAQRLMAAARLGDASINPSLNGGS